MQKFKKEVENFNEKMRRIYANPRENKAWYVTNFKEVMGEDLEIAFRTFKEKVLEALDEKRPIVALEALTDADMSRINTLIAMGKAINNEITEEVARDILKPYQGKDLSPLKLIFSKFPALFLDYDSRFKASDEWKLDREAIERFLTLEAVTDIESRPYEPQVIVTENYPYSVMTVLLKYGLVEKVKA